LASDQVDIREIINDILSCIHYVIKTGVASTLLVSVWSVCGGKINRVQIVRVCIPVWVILN
jgi:hypothetical protein